MTTLNELLARAAPHHRVECVEDENGNWSVVCRVCTETRDIHPNYGGPWTRPAPFGEEMATRIAFDHLSRMGYVPQRLAGHGQGRSRYE